MVKKIYFNNLKKNQSYTDSVKVTDISIKKFASASGDKNPIHLNEKFAKNTIFKSRIAHGMLIASFISSVIGNKFPGNGTIYVSQTLKFKRPVKINDLVKIKVNVKKDNILIQLVFSANLFPVPSHSDAKCSTLGPSWLLF